MRPRWSGCGAGWQADGSQSVRARELAKEMGVILGIAVLLDAFLVRLVLLPVLLRLTGRAAWASPAWLRRVLPAIRFSH